MNYIPRLIIIFVFILLIILPFFLSIFFIFPKEKIVFQSRASSGKTITVRADSSALAIQEAINSARDGDTIIIPAGKYFDSTALPLGLGGEIWVSESRGASETCFIRIENKNITIKGFGAVLFGEGHDKPYQDPYQKRAGVCVINSNVIFDGLRIKEFQKRCMVVFNSTIVYKNGIVDGCDEGGISFLGNSAGLIVNNLFAEMNFGGIMLWQNSKVKIINNTFYNGGIMFFYHPKTNDKMQAEIINNIIVSYATDGGQASITQVDWWKNQTPRIKENTIRTNLFWKNENKCLEVELCDFPGKISADPLFIEPVTDPRGVAAWANFGLKEGSPAIGVGEQNIPGPKILGNTGGPCVDANSSICWDFIQSNMPRRIESPTPTSILQQEIEEAPIPTQQPWKEYMTPTIQPKISPIYKDIFSQQQIEAMLYIKNAGNNKTLKIINLHLQNESQKLNKELSSLQSLKYSFASLCKDLQSKIKGALLYSSSEDNHQKIRYKNLDLNCYKTIIIDIE